PGSTLLPYTTLFRSLAHQPLRALDVAGGFLDADDAGHFREAEHGLMLQVGAGAAGHVVQHDRQVAGGFGDGAEVLVLPFLPGLVVVRHHLQLAVGADLARELRQGDRLGGRVAATAGHHRHPAGSLLDRDADDLAVLLDADRRRLAGGANHADAVRALGHMPVDKFAQRVVINAAVVVHGRDERDDAAAQEDIRTGHGVGRAGVGASILSARGRRARVVTTATTSPTSWFLHPGS